jgi:hypothetical protein
MKSIIQVEGRPVSVQVSNTAMRALESLDDSLLAEIHLIFGCMVAKRVWFKEQPSSDAVSITDKLQVCFRSVRYVKTCRLSDIDNGAVPEDFPLVGEKKRFVPDWLEIDFRKGKWKGTFGYDRAIKQENHQEDSEPLDDMVSCPQGLA